MAHLIQFDVTCNSNDTAALNIFSIGTVIVILMIRMFCPSIGGFFFSLQPGDTHQRHDIIVLVRAARWHAQRYEFHLFKDTNH